MLSKLNQSLRLICLALLFGGSAASVFTAIILVKAGEAKGIPTAQAAAANAPVFIQFSKVALGAAMLLILTEIVDYFLHKKLDRTAILRVAASAICFVTACIFALGIVPPMEALLPQIATNEATHAAFQHLHQQSRMVFGCTILFALASLLIPVFGAPERSKD
jgi:hypothetical protein